MTIKTGKCLYCGNLISKNGLDKYDMRNHIQKCHPKESLELDNLFKETDYLNLTKLNLEVQFLPTFLKYIKKLRGKNDL